VAVGESVPPVEDEMVVVPVAPVVLVDAGATVEEFCAGVVVVVAPVRRARCAVLASAPPVMPEMANPAIATTGTIAISPRGWTRG
jgi:hypothetical protein